MRVSVVVPVRNNAACLADCLSALCASAGPGAEIIVVDDASTDDTPAVAARAGVGVLRLDRNAGAGAARNLGARHASGEVLLFVDSDVVVAPDTVERVVRVLAERPDVAAVFGSYDAAPRAAGLVSQYRNLLHHFVHQHGDAEASTFWAGCGAVRRTAFGAVGGFDEGPHWQSIEDIELGYRLRAAGHRILLDREIQVTHLKRWTLASVVWTDVARRAVPWSRLLLERRPPLDHLNVKAEHRLSVALALLAAAVLPLALPHPRLLVVPLAACLGVALLNRRLLAFFARARGLAFAAATIPLLLLHYLGSGLAYLYVWSGYTLAGVRRALHRSRQNPAV